MTALEKRKSRLVVEASDCIRERGKLREVTLELHPYTLSVRLKGMRQSFELSYAAIYDLAVKKFVAQQKAEKKAKREGK